MAAAAAAGAATLAFVLWRRAKRNRDDPHKWLEEVLGAAPLKWVAARNAETVRAVGDPKATKTFERILGILDAKDKIPHINRIGAAGSRIWYNLWQDDEHVQGIWRRTTLESFKTASPEWETVLDLDALPPPETGTAKTWVWHGSTLLDEGPGRARWDRALIALSPGGSDADTVREIDLSTSKFVDPSDGGFALPAPAKSRLAYRSRDECLVGTDFGGDGSAMTDSGYPRVIKSWIRGTPLASARTVFECAQTDILAAQYAYHDRGFAHEFQLAAKTFYTSAWNYRRLSAEALAGTRAPDEAAPFAAVPVPEDAELSTFADNFLVSLRTDWTPPGARARAYASGSLLAAPIDGAMKGDWSKATLLFQPSDAASLDSETHTRDYVVLKVLEDVRTKLVVWKYDGGARAWTSLGGGALVEAGEDVSVSGSSRDEADNRVFFHRDGYLVPDTLELADASDLAATEKLKARPAQFDASGLTCEQHFATSLDGTKVPYFVIRREDAPLDGSNPTLLDAYGGFEVSELPGYSGGVGAGWLERGGVKAVANIRGGGEYGPRWHQAALKAKRHKAYEDLEAVARDLIARGITSTPKLACIGGSNGGLLVGNMITRPTASAALFGVAVCQVPLLDMKVYSKLLAGASWMAEYGDPDDPDEVSSDGVSCEDLVSSQPRVTASRRPRAPRRRPHPSGPRCARSRRTRCCATTGSAPPRRAGACRPPRQPTRRGAAHACSSRRRRATTASTRGTRARWCARCRRRRRRRGSRPRSCTGRTPRAATAAPPTTSSARSCGRSLTTSSRRRSSSRSRAKNPGPFAEAGVNLESPQTRGLLLRCSRDWGCREARLVCPVWSWGPGVLWGHMAEQQHRLSPRAFRPARSTAAAVRARLAPAALVLRRRE